MAHDALSASADNYNRTVTSHWRLDKQQFTADNTESVCLNDSIANANIRISNSFRCRTVRYKIISKNASNSAISVKHNALQLNELCFSQTCHVSVKQNMFQLNTLCFSPTRCVSVKHNVFLFLRIFLTKISTPQNLSLSPALGAGFVPVLQFALPIGSHLVPIRLLHTSL